MDGRPIPKGEYILYLTPAAQPRGELRSILHRTEPLSIKLPLPFTQDLQPVAYKQVFLGGDRDVTYISRLKSFHDKLDTQAKNEIAESSQFLATLQSQFDTSNLTFQNLKSVKNQAQRKTQWTQFDRSWSQLEGQLDSIFKKVELRHDSKQFLLHIALRIGPAKWERH